MQLAFHPTDPKVLLSGSTDGLVNIYDTTISDEDDVLLQVFNHGASIAHTAFLSEKQLFALSHDEKFTVYGLTYQDDCPESLPNEFGDLRPRLGCEYVCGFSISSDGNAIVGAGSQRYGLQEDRIWTHKLMNCREHRMDLIPLGAKEEWIFAKEHAIRLEGAHGEDIVRTFSIDEKVRIRYYRSDPTTKSVTSLLSSILAVRMAVSEPFVRKLKRLRQKLGKGLLQNRRSRKSARVKRGVSNHTRSQPFLRDQTISYENLDTPPKKTLKRYVSGYTRLATLVDGWLEVPLHP